MGGAKTTSPGGRALGKGAADDGAQDGPDAPPEARQAQVPGALKLIRVDRENGHDAHVHACTAHAGQSATDNEGVDIRSAAA